MARSPARTRDQNIPTGLFPDGNLTNHGDAAPRVRKKRRRFLAVSEIFFEQLDCIMSVLLNSSLETQGKTKRALLAERLRKAAETTIPLSFAQQRLWFLDQLEPNSPLYNVPTVAHMTGTLNVEALRHALDGMMSRHESLRTRFVDVEGSPAQLVDKSLRLNLDFHDLSNRPAAQREDEAQALVRAEVNRPFDLSSGPPVRATLIRLQPDDHWFVLNIHHIVSDEWSLKICFQELSGAVHGALREARAAASRVVRFNMRIIPCGSAEWLKRRCAGRATGILARAIARHAAGVGIAHRSSASRRCRLFAARFNRACCGGNWRSR